MANTLKKRMEDIQTALKSANASSTKTLKGKIADIERITANLALGDADLVPSKIKSGVEIFGVTGEYETAITGDAAEANVLATKTFYSDDATTKQTGTMPNNAGAVAAVSASITAGTTLSVIPATGFTDGVDDTSTIDLTTVDADLVTGNIIAGVTILGVEGKTEVVDTTEVANAATASDIALGKVAFVNGVKITGTAE
jgi:hypothetical protein